MQTICGSICRRIALHNVARWNCWTLNAPLCSSHLNLHPNSTWDTLGCLEYILYSFWIWLSYMFKCCSSVHYCLKWQRDAQNKLKFLSCSECNVQFQQQYLLCFPCKILVIYSYFVSIKYRLKTKKLTLKLKQRNSRNKLTFRFMLVVWSCCNSQ